ncbi:MAG: hypothetical protein ACKVZJ_14095 [Phycisphaerales bacterium]
MPAAKQARPPRQAVTTPAPESPTRLSLASAATDASSDASAAPAPPTPEPSAANATPISPDPAVAAPVDPAAQPAVKLPVAPTEQNLLEALLGTEASLDTLARNHTLTLRDLIAWAEQRDIVRLRHAMRKLSDDRADLIASKARVEAAHKLNKLANADGADAASKETSRKACVDLLRFRCSAPAEIIDAGTDPSADRDAPASAEADAERAAEAAFLAALEREARAAAEALTRADPNVSTNITPDASTSATTDHTHCEAAD